MVLLEDSYVMILLILIFVASSGSIDALESTCSVYVSKEIITIVNTSSLAYREEINVAMKLTKWSMISSVFCNFYT